MKLLLVAQNYYPFLGGVETHARQIAHALSRSHDVTVVAVNFSANRLPSRIALLHNNMLIPRYKSHRDGRVPICALIPRPIDRLKMLPIVARVVPGGSRVAGYFGLEKFGYGWYRRAFLPRLRQLVRDTDVVHSLAGNYLGWTAQEAALECGVPFVSTPFVHPQQWGDGPNDCAFYDKADAVIALVETDRDYLVQIGVRSEKIRVVGVSPDLPEKTTPNIFRQRHELVDHPLILYVGRMMPAKGAKALLEAARFVWQRFPDARFVFIGPPTDESELWFRRTDSRILSLGRVGPQEKADALAACDIFCMPSLSEILPTVYLEAWSFAKPVVGGHAHGLPELVEGNNAGLTASQKPEEIADALTRLLGDAQLRSRLGRNGKRLVETRYSVSAVTGALVEIYSQLSTSSTREKQACLR